MLSRLSDNVLVMLSLVCSRMFPEIIFLAANADIFDCVFVDPKLHSDVSCCNKYAL